LEDVKAAIFLGDPSLGCTTQSALFPCNSLHRRPFVEEWTGSDTSLKFKYIDFFLLISVIEVLYWCKF